MIDTDLHSVSILEYFYQYFLISLIFIVVVAFVIHKVAITSRAGNTKLSQRYKALVLRTSRRRGDRSYLRGNREPIILWTLVPSALTCVSVYSGMPRKALSGILGTGARNGLRLTVTNNTE
jgi:hypothetical protein